MAKLGRDARDFIDGIATYIKREGKAAPEATRVSSLLEKVSAQARREKQAVVESADTLTAAEKQAIAAFVGKRVGHSVSCSYRVNRDLLAGVRIAVGDWTLDTSFSSQLSRMKAELLSMYET